MISPGFASARATHVGPATSHVAPAANRAVLGAGGRSGSAAGAGPRRQQPQRAAKLVCSAHPRRVAKVSKQLEREIGSLLLLDPRLQEAVCPERRQGMDAALSGLASVTGIALSGDLQVAKVYISILSDEEGKRMAMDNLSRLEGYVRMRVGSAMRLRLVPEIRFVLDESIERGMRVLRVLDQLREQREGSAQYDPPPIALPGDGARGDEDDEDDEEEDMDVKEGSGRAGSFAEREEALRGMMGGVRQGSKVRGRGWRPPAPQQRASEEEAVPEKFRGAYTSEDALADAEFMAMRQQMGARRRGSVRPRR